jgi:ABC-2 type transport system ATP-binding protein
VAGRDILHRDAIGGLASVSVSGLTAQERMQAVAAGLELAPVSLQQLVVRLTQSNEAEFVDNTASDNTNTLKESA